MTHPMSKLSRKARVACERKGKIEGKKGHSSFVISPRLSDEIGRRETMGQFVMACFLGHDTLEL